MIMMQLHLPCSFQPLPHQQQFQQRLSASNGQRESGHLGKSGDDAAYEGSSKLGGSGYAPACVVRLRQGLRFGGDLARLESLSLDDDELFLEDEWWLLFLLDEELDLLELDFDEDDDSTIGASAQ